MNWLSSNSKKMNKETPISFIRISWLGRNSSKPEQFSQQARHADLYLHMIYVTVQSI